jgi:hypothetical protein
MLSLPSSRLVNPAWSNAVLAHWYCSPWAMAARAAARL